MQSRSNKKNIPKIRLLTAALLFHIIINTVHKTNDVFCKMLLLRELSMFNIKQSSRRILKKDEAEQFG